MASISSSLQRIKQDLQPFLPDSLILEVCRQAGHRWRDRQEPENRDSSELILPLRLPALKFKAVPGCPVYSCQGCPVYSCPPFILAPVYSCPFILARLEWADLRLAWLACKHLKSNAIALAKGGMMVGSGAGQQDRVSACRIAVAKAGDRAKEAVAASDAFFPFPDGPEILLNAGVTAIIHPGGSVRDQETTDLINSRGAALILTGQRHFKH